MFDDFDPTTMMYWTTKDPLMDPLNLIAFNYFPSTQNPKVKPFGRYSLFMNGKLITTSYCLKELFSSVKQKAKRKGPKAL